MTPTAPQSGASRARLNRQGAMVLLASIGLLFTGRVLGLFELFLLGSAGILLVIAAFVVISRARPQLDVSRHLHPPRVHAGTPSKVELSVRNAGARRTGVMRLHDPVSDTTGARLLVSPLDRGERLGASYQLPTEQRGIVRAGPLEAVAADPFGLVQRSMLVADLAELTVLPRIDNVVPLPHSVGRDDPHAGADHPNVMGHGGEDFYGLRQYVVGDDLRRVHWASTARRGELMVRQDEVPWQGRSTLLLDTRRYTTTVESFERAVSAAASIVTASARHRDLVRLVCCDGSDTGYAEGHAQVDAVMELLAVVRRTRLGSFRDVAGLLERSPSGGLVVLLSTCSDEDVQALLRMRRRFGAITVVQFVAEGPSGSGLDSLPGARSANGPGLRTLRVAPGQPFPDVWNRAMTKPGSVRSAAVSGAAS